MFKFSSLLYAYLQAAQFTGQGSSVFNFAVTALIEKPNAMHWALIIDLIIKCYLYLILMLIISDVIFVVLV
jgi:hypothetical protein